MNNEVIGDNISAPSTTECPGKLDPIPELKKFFSKLPTNVTVSFIYIHIYIILLIILYTF